MSKVIELDRMRIENVQIFERVNNGSGRPAWSLALNYTMVSAEGESLAANKIYALTSQQQLQLREFLEPFVSGLKVETDITEVENWIDSEAVLE